jgi:hypothetical protein
MIGGLRFLMAAKPSRFRRERRLSFEWTVTILLAIKARFVNYTCSYGILTRGNNLAARLSNRRFSNPSRFQ